LSGLGLTLLPKASFKARSFLESIIIYLVVRKAGIFLDQPRL